ncbi:MAG TPA: extracellular solute-binding protein [Planctomycetota bacterium]
MTARARALCLAAVFGCAAAVPATAQENEEVELQVLVHESWFAGYPFLLETARDFEAAHPGVRVRVISSAGAAGSVDKVKFMLAGKLPLDVIWIDVTEFAAFLQEDVLLDLQPWFDADPDWRPADYFAQVLAGMRGADGHLYGLPSTFTPYVMYANLSLLHAEGFARPPPDWTWNDLLRICRAVTRDADGDGRPEQYGISLTQWLQALVPWIWQNGGRLLDEHGRSALAEPAAVEAVDFLAGLLHREKVASDDATFANQLQFGLFQAGRAAFYGPVGYWETYRFQAIEDFEWDVLPLPRNKVAATSMAMRFYCVPRASERPQLAYEFVRALAADSMQRGLAQIGNGVPGLIRAAESEDFLKPVGAPESEQVFLDVLEHARFLPIHVNWREIEQVTKATLEDAILLGRVPAAEACAEAARLTDEILARDTSMRARPAVPAWAFPAAQLSGLAVVLLLVFRGLRRGARPRLAVREERAAWMFLAPWAAGLALFLLGPAAVAALLSFTEWSPVRDLGGARWMGFGQWQRLAEDGTFHDALRVTAVYALAAVPLQTALALGLALLVRRSFRGSGTLRTLFYLPTIVSPVVLGVLWRWLLTEDGGMVNRALAAAGVQGPDWLGAPAWVLPAFVLMGLWTIGAQMLVFLAGLQTVEPSLYEAARVDGASAWARFRHVTLPALGPLLLFNLVVGTIAAFQVFAQPLVMTQGGPGNESRFLALYMWEQGFRFLRMGYASTLAWVLFAVVFALTLVILRSSRRWVHYAGAGR